MKVAPLDRSPIPEIVFPSVGGKPTNFRYPSKCCPPPSKPRKSYKIPTEIRDFFSEGSPPLPRLSSLARGGYCPNVFDGGLGRRVGDGHWWLDEGRSETPGSGLWLLLEGEGRSLGPSARVEWPAYDAAFLVGVCAAVTILLQLLVEMLRGFSAAVRVL